MNKPLIALIIIILAVGGFFILNKQKDETPATSHKDATYVIDGRTIQLKDGLSEIEAAPNSASKIVTRYFGNEVKYDANGDGREDVAFLLTQDTGGTGTFFYVVAALTVEGGYAGSQGFLLGDRIAPQTTEVSQNPNHVNVIVVNYADRAPGEGFTTPPSVGKSIWLKLNPENLQFGEVAQNFEGEADPSRMSLDMKTWVWQRTNYNNDTQVVPRAGKTFSITFGNNGTFSVKTDCNNFAGKYTASNGKIIFLTDNLASLPAYCEGSQEAEFTKFLQDATPYHFTSRGELVLELKFDSGTVVLR